MTDPANDSPSALPVLAPEKRPGAKALFTLETLADVPLCLEAPLGTVDTNVREILSFAPGSILMLDRLTGESIPVTANGTVVARGEVRVHGERFAVRVTEILGRPDRERAGGAEPHAKSPSVP